MHTYSRILVWPSIFYSMTYCTLFHCVDDQRERESTCVFFIPLPTKVAKVLCIVYITRWRRGREKKIAYVLIFPGYTILQNTDTYEAIHIGHVVVLKIHHTDSWVSCREARITCRRSLWSKHWACWCFIFMGFSSPFFSLLLLRLVLKLGLGPGHETIRY